MERMFMKLSPTQEKALAILREPGNKLWYMRPWGNAAPYYFDEHKHRHFRESTVDGLLRAQVARRVYGARYSDYHVIAQYQCVACGNYYDTEAEAEACYMNERAQEESR